MKFTDLNPNWVGAGGPGIFRSDGSPSPKREGVGVTFDCPCGCDVRTYIPFANPLDGGAALKTEHATWQRTGETFENLTLKPSIRRTPAKGGCGWHGFVTGGQVDGKVEP